MMAMQLPLSTLVIKYPTFFFFGILIILLNYYKISDIRSAQTTK